MIDDKLAHEHDWDKEGERCETCGAKDWMTAVPPAASASSENDSVVAARNPKETPEIYIDLDEYQ